VSQPWSGLAADHHLAHEFADRPSPCKRCGEAHHEDDLEEGVCATCISIEGDDDTPAPPPAVGADAERHLDLSGAPAPQPYVVSGELEPDDRMGGPRTVIIDGPGPLRPTDIVQINVSTEGIPVMSALFRARAGEDIKEGDMVTIDERGLIVRAAAQ